MAVRAARLAYGDGAKDEGCALRLTSRSGLASVVEIHYVEIPPKRHFRSFRSSGLLAGKMRIRLFRSAAKRYNVSTRTILLQTSTVLQTETLSVPSIASNSAGGPKQDSHPRMVHPRTHEIDSTRIDSPDLRRHDSALAGPSASPRHLLAFAYALCPHPIRCFASRSRSASSRRPRRTCMPAASP